MKYNDSPLFLSLLECIREGDLEKVSALVDNFSVELNAVDKYDYSPLILASLCGHITIVSYLLEHGAILERDTFDGARCLYGALNDEIRNLLLKYDASTTVDLLQPFAAHLTALRRNNLQITTADVILHSSKGDAETFEAHKFLLYARTGHFREHSKLINRWRTDMDIDMPYSGEQLTLLMRFVYLDNLEAANPGSEADIAKLSDHLGTPALAEYFSTANAVSKTERQQAQLRKAQDDLELYVQEEVINKAWVAHRPHAERGGDEAVSKRLQRDQSATADSLLIVPFSDDEPTKVRVYPVHKSMLIKAEYFLTALSSGFAESQQANPIFTLEISSQVAELVLMFLYTDRVQIPRDVSLDVLETASFLFLNTLKSMAAISVTSIADELPHNTDIYSILRIGWRTETQRLEQFAAKYLASHLDEFLYEEDFRDLVLESASRISNRQETDTIELVDDIRFYLSQSWGIYLEMNPPDERKPGSAVKEDNWVPLTQYELEYNEQLTKLDEVLSSLSLDA